MARRYITGLLACAAASASAQTVSISVFDAPQDTGSNSQALITTFSEIEELSTETVPAEIDVRTLTNPFSVAVPQWMQKDGVTRPAFVRYAEYSFLRGGCGSKQYYLFPGISEAAQRRRAIYFDQMATIACEEGLSVRLFDALIVQESRYNPFARSHAGAQGMAQLMPATARYLGVVNSFDPVQNMRGGARYLREQLDRFGSWELALGAYNAGPHRIEQYGGLPPFRETRQYVATIMRSLSDLTFARAEVAPLMPQEVANARSVKLMAFWEQAQTLTSTSNPSQ